jgi:sodium transport system permease protein
MISLVPGVEFEWVFTLIPVVNICMGMKEVLLGVHEPLKIVTVFGVTVFYAAIALYITSRIFQRESVLFRT